MRFGQNGHFLRERLVKLFKTLNYIMLKVFNR